jgi:hypothetical protein
MIINVALSRTNVYLIDTVIYNIRRILLYYFFAKYVNKICKFVTLKSTLDRRFL